MKRVLFSAVVILAALTACRKESGEPSGAAPDGYFTISVQAVKSSITKALALNGNAIDATWAEGEYVAVYSGNSSTQIGTLSPTTFGTASTKLEGTIDAGSLAEGSKLTLMYPGNGNLSYEEQDGTLESISSTYDFASAYVTVSSIVDGHVSVSDATFANCGIIVKFSLMDEGGNPLNASKLIVSANKGLIIRSDASEAGWNNIYGTLAVTAADPMSDFTVAFVHPGDETDTYSLTASVGEETYTFVRNDFLFKTGFYYTGTVHMKAGTTYTVAGVSALCGLDWAPTATENDMVKDGDVYTKTFTGVEPGTYYFKVVRNHSWDDASWPEREGDNDNNYEYTVLSKGDLTIVFNPGDSSISVSFTPEATGDPYRIYFLEEGLAAAGNGWGTERSVWAEAEYSIVGSESFGDYTYKYIEISEGLVGKSVDVYYKGEDSCEVGIMGIAIAEDTHAYYFRTDGILYAAVTDPAAPEALDATPRFWVRSSESNLRAHLWNGEGSFTSWPGEAMTASTAKQYSHYWYYYNIPAGTTGCLAASVDYTSSSEYSVLWQTGDISVPDDSKSYYYYAYGSDNYAEISW